MKSTRNIGLERVCHHPGAAGPGSNPETRMTKLTQRLFPVAASEPNLRGHRQRAPYPLRPPGKNGEGKIGADDVL